MAIPPEPLVELLPQVAAVFVGEVVDVLLSDPDLPDPPHARGATDVGRKAPRQEVVLAVREVLRGALAPGAKVTAIKPVAAYALRAGNHGPFLLDASQPPVILGRYGPDSYTIEKLRAALAK